MTTWVKLLTVHADAAKPWQVGFQDPASPVMEGIVDLHHTLLFYLTVIIVFVSWMLARTFIKFANNSNPSKNTHGGALEIIWTIVPSFVLAAIAIPSFGLLYLIDEVVDPAITLKVVGHQWYWSYEYSDYVKEGGDSIAFDSYMVQEDDLKVGQLRLLEVDNKVVLPILTHIRVIITATDVLHSFAVPSLALKLDAVPGRLNQCGLVINREGTFYGQCSEICGVNHGFMPIVIKGVTLDEYVKWIQAKLEEA